MQAINAQGNILNRAANGGDASPLVQAFQDLSEKGYKFNAERGQAAPRNGADAVAQVRNGRTINASMPNSDFPWALDTPDKLAEFVYGETGQTQNLPPETQQQFQLMARLKRGGAKFYSKPDNRTSLSVKAAPMWKLRDGQPLYAEFNGQPRVRVSSLEDFAMANNIPLQGAAAAPQAQVGAAAAEQPPIAPALPQVLMAQAPIVAPADVAAPAPEAVVVPQAGADIIGAAAAPPAGGPLAAPVAAIAAIAAQQPMAAAPAVQVVGLDELAAAPAAGPAVAPEPAAAPAAQAPVVPGAAPAVPAAPAAPAPVDLSTIQVPVAAPAPAAPDTVQLGVQQPVADPNAPPNLFADAILSPMTQPAAKTEKAKKAEKEKGPVVKKEFLFLLPPGESRLTRIPVAPSKWLINTLAQNGVSFIYMNVLAPSKSRLDTFQKKHPLVSKLLTSDQGTLPRSMGVTRHSGGREKVLEFLVALPEDYAGDLCHFTPNLDMANALATSEVPVAYIRCSGASTKALEMLNKYVKEGPIENGKPVSKNAVDPEAVG